jgi:hypothetical protein
MSRSSDSLLHLSAAQHLVERRARDLSEPRDLGLGQAGVDGLPGKDADGVAFMLGLLPGSGAGPAMTGECGAEFIGHSCIVLDNAKAA